ncbi:MAG: SurA N-terminal domain-containing protein [Terracidiphilus sp.]|nr:SurA N-terminal domain-containing protein [Terracidiphilus sp.]
MRGMVAALAVLVASGAAAAAQTKPAALAPAGEEKKSVVLDSVVAVVNRHAILASDIDEEIRLSVLDPAQNGQNGLTRQKALEQLISRTLIEQQIRREDERSAEPTRAEVDARLAEIRRELPFCLRRNCASDEGWKQVLAIQGLTPERVVTYLRYRLQILAFIELRFRQGIRITPEEVKEYYTKTLAPQYAPGEPVPPLEAVSSRLEEILLEQRVNVLFGDWLENLRKQGDVEVLDPSLESATPAAVGVVGQTLEEGKGGAR